MFRKTAVLLTRPIIRTIRNGLKQRFTVLIFTVIRHPVLQAVSFARNRSSFFHRLRPFTTPFSCTWGKFFPWVHPSCNWSGETGPVPDRTGSNGWTGRSSPVFAGLKKFSNREIHPYSPSGFGQKMNFSFLDI